MKILNITITNKIATYFQRDGVIVCGNNDYKVKFTFDSEWNGHEEKTARFIWNGMYYDQTFTGNECPVPIISGATKVSVGVYAGDLSTTTPAVIPCKKSILCAEAQASEGLARDYVDEALQTIENAGTKAVETVREAALEAVGELGVVQSTGNSENAVMSQKATTDAIKSYIPKTATRNLMDVTFENANIDGQGIITPPPAPSQTFASAPDFIPVTGGENYTLSWAKNNKAAFFYLFEYTTDYTLIKYTNIGASNNLSKVTKQLDANCAFVRFKLWFDGTCDNWKEIIPENLQFEHGAEATEFIKSRVISAEDLEMDAIGNKTKETLENSGVISDAIKSYIPKIATRNLLNATFENADIDKQGAIIPAGSQSFAASPDYIPVTGGESYTLSWIKSAKEVVIYLFEYNSNYTLIKYTSTDPTNKRTGATKQLDANCAFVRLKLWFTGTCDNWKEIIPENLQFEHGAEATTYVQPLTIPVDELDEHELADKMRANGAMFRDDRAFEYLPEIETLPSDAWERGALNSDGTEREVPYFRTAGYIQLRKGDVINKIAGGALIDVFEYDLATKEFISGCYVSGFKSSYTAQNDCAARIVHWGSDASTAPSDITITRASRERLVPGVTPLSYIENVAKRVADKKNAEAKAEILEELGANKNVSRIKFTASQNSILRQIAHRGYRDTGAPQCTAPAYIEAKKFGYSAGENDLWVTTDGVFVMAHDTTLPSDRSVVIAESTYETLLSGNMGTFNGVTIPIMTFEEWLILMKKIGLEPFIDLKPLLTAEQSAEAVAIVRKHGMLNKITWCTSSLVVARDIRAAHPSAKIALLGSTTIQADSDLIIEGKPELTILYPQSIYVTAEVISNAQNAGAVVECWHCDYSLYGFTTEEAILGEVERIVDLGVTGVCLDTYLPGEYFINKLNAEWGLQ